MLKIVKNGPTQVAMAPFGLIFDGNEAKWFDKHVYTPPGPVLRHIQVEIA